MPPRIYSPDEQARRYAASEEALIAEGGKRFTLRLRGTAVQNMQALMEEHGCNQTEAIELALNQAAVRLAKRRR